MGNPGKENDLRLRWLPPRTLHLLGRRALPVRKRCTLPLALAALSWNPGACASHPAFTAALAWWGRAEPLGLCGQRGPVARRLLRSHSRVAGY